MTAQERAVIVRLRAELGNYVRKCPGCLGAGLRRPSSCEVRPCRLCQAARAAIAASDQMLLPTWEPEHQ
jgi:hypothetical protein